MSLAGNLPREQSLSVEARYYVTARDWDRATDLYRTLFGFFPDNLDYGLRLTEAQVEAGKLDDSQATIQALRKLPPPSGEDPRIDLQEATAARARSDYQRELAAASWAVAKGESRGSRRLIAQARNVEGAAYRRLGDLKKSLAASFEARQLFAAVGDRFGEAKTTWKALRSLTKSRCGFCMTLAIKRRRPRGWMILRASCFLSGTSLELSQPTSAR